MRAIVVIGASVNWSPKLLTDLMAVFDEQLEIRFVDINPANSALCVEWGEAANRHYGRKDIYRDVPDLSEALHGAEAVLITISTGGFEAMEQDIRIPEKYGILATVGDTAGPGGWSRAVRNIPVFMDFAEKFSTIAPEAFIVNYTNPMSALTGVLQTYGANPTVGLCHAYFETMDVIQSIFGLPDWSGISVSVAGLNHFTWITDFSIFGKDGYTLLREKLAGRSLRAVMPRETSDDIGFISGHELCIELFDQYGYLPYPADRHICEFLPFTISNHPKTGHMLFAENMEYDTILPWNIRRTEMWHRQVYLDRSREILESMFSAEAGAKPVKSRETGADMIRSYLENKPICDAVNCLNVGQIPDLSLGTCVETLGVVDGSGVRPLVVPHLPEPVLELIRPQAVNVKWIIEGMLHRDKDLLVQALVNDPQCKGLRPGAVREMADQLITSNQRFTDLSFLK